MARDTRAARLPSGVGVYMEQVRRCIWLMPLLAAGTVLGYPSAAEAQFGPISNRFELSGSVHVDEADTEAKAHLEQARQFIEVRQWDEAIDTLRAVLENHRGKVFAISDKRYISLRNYCHLQLAALPAEALELYRRRVDPQARAWYEQGLAQRDGARLRQVVDEFYCSSYGDDALLALGELALERGDFAAARGYWEQILAQPAQEIPANRFREVLHDGELSADARRMLEEWYVLFTADGKARYKLRGEVGRWPAIASALAEIKSRYSLPQVTPEYPASDIEPVEVMWRLTLVSILEGSPERAQVELAGLEQLYPTATGRLGGRQVNLVQGLRELLEDSRQWPRATPSGDWPTFAGAFERTRAASRVIDVGSVKWRVPLPPPPPADFGYMPRRVAEDRNALLSYHPLVIGDVVLVNTEHDIRAYNLHTGQAAWGDSPIIPMEESAADVRRHTRNMLGAPRFTMTAHAGRLYARMGNPITSSPAEPFPQLREGYLVCLDLTRQGLVVWRSGHGEAFAPPAGEQWAFEGSPVTDGANVYVALRRGGVRPQAHVACLDAETGRLRWRQMVCSAETPGQGQSDECTHNLLTLHGDTLYYNTNLGAVASLSTRDGQVQWITLYSRAQSGDLNQRASHFYRDLTPAVLDRSRLFVAPADSRSIIAIDAPSGMLLWESSHPDDAVHLLGVGQENLLASGDKLWALNASTGKLAYREWPEGPSPKGHGRGLLAGDKVLWPTRGAIEVFEQSTGRRVREIPLSVRGVEGGNLLVAGEYLLVTTSHELICLHERIQPGVAADNTATAAPATAPRAIAAHAAEPSAPRGPLSGLRQSLQRAGVAGPAGGVP